MKISDEDSRGCLLESDIEYPAEIHDAHNEFPLLSEKMFVLAGNYKPKVASEFPTVPFS